MDSASHLAPIPLRALPERPKVSILLSNYNYGEYIGQAIESVLAQTYDNFELIICDDGSTDNSRQIIADYGRRDSRIQLIAKGNGGQGSGFNVAFASSTGELICFLDSDDLFYPEKLSCVVENYHKSPDSGFSIHRIQKVSKTRRPQGVWPRKVSVFPNGWHGERMLESGGILSYMPPTSGLSLHRSVAEKIFPLPETYPLTNVADQVITRLAPLLTPVLGSSEVLAAYRLHDANNYWRSKKTTQSILREITTCRNLWKVQHEFLETLGPDMAAQLQPVDKSSYMIFLEYLYARFSRSSLTPLIYSRYIHDLERYPEARGIWFWKASIYLPSFLFDGLINLIAGHNLLKVIINRLRGFT